MAFSTKRTAGPLGKLQKSSDKLKTKVDHLSSSVSKISLKNAEQNKGELKKYLEKLINYKVDASNLLLVSTSLTKNDEPELVNEFEGRKNDEVKRLQDMQEQIDKLLESVTDLQTSKNGVKIVDKKPKVSARPNQESDDDDEDTEDFDDESDEEEAADLYIVISNFKAAEAGDLTIQVDEIIDVLEKNEDGWWKAQNSKGKVGVVPSNFIRVYQQDNNKEVDDQIDDRKNVDADDVTSTATHESSDDVTIEQQEEEEESDDEEDDVSEREHIVVHEKKKNMGPEIKEIIEKASETDQRKSMNVTDVLTAMEALPSGFRNSELQKLEGKYKLSNMLQAKLKDCHLYYKNLRWDQELNQLREETNRLLRTIQVMECRNIPTPGQHCDVIDRHIRVCLFDGQRILSNIWKVRCRSPNVSKPKLWKVFSSKESLLGANESCYDNLLLVRTTNIEREIGVMFELSVTYTRKATKEKGELCCGWAFLPLHAADGKITDNKTYKLPVNGGTIYEHGTPLDITLLKTKTSNKLTSFLSAPIDPILVIKLEIPGKKYKKVLDFLPDIIVLPLCDATLVTWFRRYLADVIMRDREFTDDVTPVHSPQLKSFLQMCDHCDVMDGMRALWNEKVTEVTDKNDKDMMTSLWKEIVMGISFPLSTRPIFLHPTEDENISKKRWIEIVELVKNPNNPLKNLLEQQYEPFNATDDVTYHIITPPVTS